MPSPAIVASLGALGLALVPACGPGPAEGPAAAGSPAAAEAVAAYVAGDPITVAELDDRIKNELHELRLQSLQRMIDERLLEAETEARGLSAEELLAESSGEVAIGDAEVREFYDANAARMAGRSFEEVEERIRGLLEQQKKAQGQRALIARLRESAGVEIALEAPRFDVEAVGPGLGPDGAPITIVEFSDYECPYCKRAEPVVKQILERYPEQVRFVYRHFPLGFHAQAKGAAEAASCADEQGRFWEYHAMLFEKSPALDAEALRRYAAELGLDAERFGSCLDEGRVSEVVQNDLEAGQRLGVQGTPAFFVNGVRLSGARPFEDFERLIERELKAAEDAS